MLPKICLSTYKPRKRKAKEKPFNLLHRFEIEINQWQMKSTIESKRELNKSKFVLDKHRMKKLETLRSLGMLIQEYSLLCNPQITHKLSKTILTQKSKTKPKQHIP